MVRAVPALRAALGAALVALFIARAQGESLTPPYFNLAEGKRITASATCGEGLQGPEMYCKLIGTNGDNDLTENVIQGQYCDYCDPDKFDKRHPPEYAVDGMETWWQSPPLSRGMKYNEVNLTIELGQEFHVAYVYIKMAISPRPGLWVLEKSADYGQTYTPWQYFSDSPADCETFFGRDSLAPITRDDSVICTTEYSKIVPLEGGEIPISLLKNRPSANHYFNSTVLQEWTRATNVRLRLLRTKNLLGHLMSVARQDPTVTRRYFYAIKDISIGGRCMCNGHAEACDIPDPRDSKILLCHCQHNTCGAKCDQCCPGFEQKAWRQSKHDAPFSCEPCNCFDHSYECEYDPEIDRKHLSLDIHGRYEGGGVCKNCQHNTEGINCNKCQPTFYRPYRKHWNETDVCQPCNCNTYYSTGKCAEGSGRCECKPAYTPPHCDSCSFGYYGYPDCRPCECYLNGTLNQQCTAQEGLCDCLPNFGGDYCKECAPGYFNFTECTRCQCDPQGSVSEVCDQTTGACTCKNKYAGLKCDQCRDGYFYSGGDCTYCNCDRSGTEEGICDKQTGQCICKPGYGGERCDMCILSYYGHPDCKPCNCSKVGSHGTTCSASGKCSCLTNYAGRTCDQCSPGYYNYPECKPCDCDSHGSLGISCDLEGKCECKENFAENKCDVCKEGYYNFPACEDCNCHPAGVVAGFAGCGSVPAGELCQCKERVEGRICDRCKPLYWNLNLNNPHGCEECQCDLRGTLGGLATCDTEAGQCTCKPSVVARRCSECADGTYGLMESDLFGCTDCGCDVGGSLSNVCNKQSGQCQCQSRVTGRTCKEPLQAHYFPTLYHYQYEAEKGRTPENNRVRLSYDETVFPNFSWKGYATFSVLQKEIIQDIYIDKPSLYRMVLRFVNRNPHTVIGGVRVIPDNPNDIEQYHKVQLRNTSKPAFVTLSGETGNTPKPFVMNPGRWSVSITVSENIFLDYFVLLPEDFYLASILNQKVEKPCKVDEIDLCRHYAYPTITGYSRSWGVGGFIQGPNNDQLQLKEWFPSQEHLQKIQAFNRVPLLNSLQPEITFNITVPKPGAYILVVNYVTPLDDLRTHNISVRTQTRNGEEVGQLKFYACPYTTMCRQVVADTFNGVGVYTVDGNNILLTMNGVNTNVGVHSVYAIPHDDWSMDQIRPKPVCVRKNGTCIPSTFHNPPETKKIQFEDEVEGELAKNRPPLFVDNETTYVWLNATDNTVDLKGKVPTPGYYTFILHYRQPHYPEFDLDVIIQNGQFYEAKVPVSHCPSESGCRAVVTEANRNDKFSLTENFMITVKQPDNKSVFLDYLLVVPADLYDSRSLEEEDLDRTGEFINTCGSNHFYIDTNETGFCRDAIFSITTNHKNGALPCECDFAGSDSFVCEKFGGQCKCKENIIGRRCEACKTGYYGFPECKPCNCPSTAYCEPNTGECICPPHVVGEKCDQCEPFTYGFDPYNGCEECRCNPLGVANNTRQCNLLTGDCPCQENVFGRTCDHCKPGYYSFPYCASCECNEMGTTSEVCDKETAQCFCKKNVVGPQCSMCHESTFNLQPENEEGCTECFCFGKSKRCISSNYVKVSLNVMKDWKMVSLNATEHLNVTHLNLTTEDIDDISDVIGVDFSYYNVSQAPAYFAAPPDYLGKKLTSYGGFLNYTIYYVIGQGGSAVGGPDVILQGPDYYLTYSNLEQPPPASEFAFMLQLVEGNFELPSGSPAKREHVMEVLKDLRGVYLRATYWTASVTTRLIDVLQDEAIPTDPGYENNENVVPALSVEQCMCPPNYQGLSCEECAPGYYRVQGPHGGYCIPCECHGHATECDVNTGICLNCMHNTKGDHCEICDVGYHGNAKAGTPRDCLICACPLPIASNNFAVGCQVSADGEKISCDCKEGYIGARCQSCDAGFYGRPESQGDFCRPCQCSGNIDPRDPSSCDTVTGECLRCLNNTFGTACSLCAPGFFGDAIHLKDCQACICDETGTDHCDSYTGRCVCKPNVVGEKCDRCEADHYGFHSGRGCVECGCTSASESDQCEDATGQCKCKPGAAGRACDRCAAGYWNYTSEGCQSCGCKSEYSLGFGCNAQTGQCECLQGVIGEKCDQCPYRWAFVPEVGCHACDSCHHALLNDTDELAAMIDPIIFEFDSAQSGFFTRRRLANMREQLDTLTSKLKDVDPKQVSLDETIQELESLEQDTKNLNRKSNYSLENSELLKNKSEELKDTLEILLDDINTVEDVATMTIDDINTITVQLTKETGKEIDNALQEGQEYLNQIKGYNLTGRQADANKTLEKVEAVLRNVTEYKLPVEELQEKVDEIKGNLIDIDNKLDDLFNHSQYSLNMAREAENIIAKSGKDRLKGKLSNIENQVKQSGINLDKSEELLSNASKLLDISIGKLKELQDAPETLEGMNRKFEKELESNRKKIDEIQVLKPKVQEHAQNLSDRVQELEHILSESQYGSQDAVKAARAYKDIVAAVKSAREAADSAQNDSSNAAEILANVHERTNDAESNSATALEDAHNSSTMVHQKLKPMLNQSIEKYIPVKDAHKRNEDLLNEIEKMLKNIQIKDLNTAYKNASDTADAAADTISRHVEPAVNNLFNKLSEETQQAKLLPKELNDMERNLKQTEKQLNTVNENLPSVIQSLEEIPKKQAENKRTSNNIQSNINKLNQQIELARDVANRIKVGVKFYPNTTLELRNPKNIEDLTTATKFSGYFKTSRPNGLLFYIGNPQGTSLPKTKTDDFMALIIQNGYPVLKMDLGNGVQKIINEKYVADDNWYQYIVERVGHNAKLTIREELPDRSVQNYVKETALSGPYTIFNLDKDKSKIFVGGYPSKYDAQLQDQVDMGSFQGEIEDVVIGNTPVSLWNFADGYENNHGSKERNKLVVLSPNTGFRFNGNGYAILEARSISFRIKSAIELSFKTFAPTGLLFLAGKGNTFISIELQNGKVLYQYNLGGATKRWVSSATYNDGQWHKIVAERDGARGRLQVDDENVTDRTKPITGSSLDIIDTMSFGGYPNLHKYGDVTNIRFDGCISNVTIMKTPIDLRANIQAYDVTPGCPDKFAPMVSFDQRQQGYISWDRISIQNRFNASLKFKTMEPEGLIFYVRDLAEENGISLSLRDGHLVLISQQIELVSKDTFNDGQWHVVSVIHDDTILRLDTDDYGFKVTDHPPPPIHVLYSTLHVGGLPTQPVPLRVGSSAPFRGCIADLTIMGRVMNFANTTDRSYAILDKCILDHDVSVEVPVPTLKPVKPLQAVTTQSPVFNTVNPEEAAKAGRGDGGNDFLRTSTEGARGVPPPSTAAPEIRRPVGTVPPTTPRPKLEGCALPLDPKRENERDVGYRLGTQRYSRLKFGTPRGKYKKRFDFRLEFKTRESDGILFYASNRDHSHYAAVYLEEGKVVFTFKAEEAVVIKSRFIYDDDIWHIVEFNRDLANGKLVIDKEVAEGSAQNSNLLELHVPFYMGGVDPDEYNLVQANLNTTSSFMGCIRSIQMNSFQFEPSETFGVIPCSENVELGSYFAGDLNTYVKLKEKFKVGEVFNLKMDIKPRVISGVLAAAHGKKDYYVLELHNGHLQLTVENGRGPVTASFTADSPDHKYHLCDGQWHTIQAVKSKNVITLSVDSMFTSPKVGPAHSTSTDTGSALFLGGHRFIKKVRGIQSRTPYVGCVRNVSINDERVDLTTLPSTFINGNVDIGYCPTS